MTLALAIKIYLVGVVSGGAIVALVWLYYSLSPRRTDAPRVLDLSGMNDLRRPH